MAKPHYDLALTSYHKAIGGLRSYIENNGQHINEEITLVTLVACLLFVCFEMLQGDQKLVISHLVKGMKLLFARYRATDCVTPTMRPVVLGTDFPDLMDDLADVFVRLDSDSTMFGRRSTYLCTTCRCCSKGSEITINHGFASVKEARSHLDLLTSNTFRLRGNMLKLTEKILGTPHETELWTDASGGEDWAKRYCNLYAKTRLIDVGAYKSGRELLVKQEELITAFTAWRAEFDGLLRTADDLVNMMLRIECFFPWFIVSTLRDKDETACDRFHADFAEVVDRATDYMERTKINGESCGFALESGILRSLYIVALKCRDWTIRRRATTLLFNATVQEGLWSGKVFASYLQRVIDAEERQTRILMPCLPVETPLTYHLVPEAARIRDVVLASDDARPTHARVICAQQPSTGDGALQFVEDSFQLLSV